MSVPLAGQTSQEHANSDLASSEKSGDRIPGAHSTQDRIKDDVQVLRWEVNDKANPLNWSKQRKWLVTGTALFATLIFPLNGTSITVAANQINEAFNVSDASFPNSYWPVCSWNVGGAISIILLLPLMEDLGVRVGFITTYVFFLLMIVPQALAQNFATLVVTRFFSGGCVALLANTISSMIPDVWEEDKDRSIPVGVYIIFYLAGNTLGPPIFAAITQYNLVWRWIFYIQLIFYGALFPIFIVMIKETRGSVILRRRAKRMRKDTGKPIYTEDELNTQPLYQKLAKSSSRPLYLLVTEPVLFATTLWSAFSFGTVFLFTQSVEQVFAETYGWQSYSTGYVQGAVVVGEVLGWLGTFYAAKLWLRSAARNTEAPGKPIPEARLYVSVFGSFVGTTGGMFVYAWTSYPNLPWIAPTIGLAMVGFGIQTVVSAAADYITDAYAASNYAASAISAVAFGENMTASFLPLAALKLYTNLGFQWASTLLAFLAMLLSFAPVLFIWKGRQFRARSPFMQSGGQLQQKEQVG